MAAVYFGKNYKNLMKLRSFFKALPPYILLGIVAFTFVDRGGIPFLSHVVLIFGVFAVALSVLLGGRVVQKVRLNWAVGLFSLYVLLFLISLLASRVPGYGLSEFFTVFGLRILSMLIVAGALTKEDLPILKWGGSVVLLLSLLIGTGAYILFPFDRFTGPFMNFGAFYEVYPNDYASFLLIMLPFLFYYVLKERNAKARRFFIVLAGFSFAAFALTLSRGALLSFTVALIIILLLRRLFAKKVGFSKNNIKRVAAVFVMALLFGSGLLLGRAQYQSLANLKERVDLYSYEGNSAIQTRMEFWRGALMMSKERPLIGLGPTSFKFNFPKYQESFGIAQDQPHNFYIKTLAENGFLTFAAFVAFLVILTWRVVQKLKARGSVMLWTASFATLAVLGNNLVDDTLNFVAISVPFGLLLGYLMLIATKASVARRFFKAGFLKGFLLVTTLLLFLVASHELWFNMHFRFGKAALADGNKEVGIMHLEYSDKMMFRRDLSKHLLNAYDGVTPENEARFVKRENLVVKILEDESYDPEMLHAAGKHLESSGALGLALDIYNKALKLDPSNTIAYYAGEHRGR
jgi:O-antigen ligase